MFVRIALFVSSYIPLYLLLIVAYVIRAIASAGFTRTVVGDVSACVILVIGGVAWIVARRTIAAAFPNDDRHEGDSKSKPPEDQVAYYKLERKEAELAPSLLNYLAIFFMPCLGMNIGDLADCIIMVFVISTVGFVYVKERSSYLNPLLLKWGFKSCCATLYELKDYGEERERQSSIGVNAKVLYRTCDELREGAVYRGWACQDFIALTRGN